MFVVRVLVFVVAVLAVGTQAWAQDVGKADAIEARALPKVLGFEDLRENQPPVGWDGGPPGTIFSDNSVAHGGRWSARLERKSDSRGEFTSLHRAIAMNFTGQRVILSGWLRTENVEEFAGLWLRQDGRDGGSLAFDNMARRNLKGTTGWAQFTIKLPIQEDAEKLVFGALLVGSGRVWVDDLALSVDGKPVWQARKKRPTVLSTDRQFDGGSGLEITDLNPMQVENLATLGQVWGFLKYHHPAVRSGKVHWDYALLRVLPAIIRAADRSAANAAMVTWIDGLGPIAPCSKCARLDESKLHLRPDLRWIDDEAMLGAALSAKLRAVARSRSATGKQFYVSLADNVRNPVFDHEPPYRDIALPDPSFQLIAVYRFWNMVEYWSPYRDVIGEDWRRVLVEFIPRVTLAKDADAYRREVWALLARLNDGHASLSKARHLLPPTGDCQFPLSFRFAEKRPVIERVEDKGAGLEVGDVVTAIDNVPVGTLLDRWRPYHSASNTWALDSSMAFFMGRGACGEGSLSIAREGKARTFRLPRTEQQQSGAGLPRDLPGPSFRLLSKDVAYLKLSSVTAADVAKHVDAAAGTKGFIVDIRNYPSEFVVFALGSLLVKEPTPFARFTIADLDHPGAFHWTEPLVLQPAAPHYPGKVVVLIDETSMSQAEYTAMAFRASPRTTVIGSPTAGADGNVSPFPLPGGLGTGFSGIGVFYPDKRTTQRVGIVPDIVVQPTSKGLREGRDEVLEAAVRRILGDDSPEDEVRRLTRPSGS